MLKHLKKKKFCEITITYVFLIFIACLVSLPFIWLIATSLKSDNEALYKFPQALIALKPTLDNYKNALKFLDFSNSAFNSMFITLSVVAINVVVCSLAAYPLARMEFPGKKIIFGLIMFTFMVPFQAIVVPLFLVVLKLNINNTYVGAILPVGVSAFGILLLRQAFEIIPKDIEDAAMIDGCSGLVLWWKIFMPLVSPSIAGFSVLIFVQEWNEFLWKMIVLHNEKLFPLPIKLLNLTQGVFQGNWRDIAAASTITMIPVLLFFFIMQRYFLEGLMEGSVKQ